MRNTMLFKLLAGPGLGMFAAAFASASPIPIDRIDGAVAADTLLVVRRPDQHGLQVEPEMSLPHGESLIRQGLYGQRQFRRSFGRRSSVAWARGVRRAAWTLPQLLRSMEFKSLLAGSIPPGHSVEYPYENFLWEGNDGSRIHTLRPIALPDEIDPDSLLLLIGSRDGWSASHKVVLAEIDKAGEDRLREFQRLNALPGLRFSSPETAVSTIRRRTSPDSVTVWREGLAFEEGGGSSSVAAGLAERNHTAEVGLKTSEALAAIASGLPGGPVYPRDRLGRAWRQVLANQSQDIMSGPAAAIVPAEAHSRYDSAAATIDSIVMERFATIRSEMDTRGDGGGSYVLFNPLGHPRVGPALVVIPAPIAGETSTSAGTNTNLALVNVPEVPAFGAVAIPIGRDGLPGISVTGLAPPAGGDNWIENAFLRIEIDPLTGAITSILDKSNGRQALRAGGRANVLWVQGDRLARQGTPDPSTGVQLRELTTLLSFSSSVTARAATVTLLRQWGSSTVRQELILGRSAPFLEIRSVIEHGEEPGTLSVSFEPAVAPDSATWEVPYGTDKGPGRPPAGGMHSHGMLPGQRWADVSADGFGFSVLAEGSQEWQYEIGVLRLSLVRSKDSTGLIGDHEAHRLRYAIYPHAGDWLAAGTHRLAAEYNVPLMAAIEPSHRGRLGKRFSFLSTTHSTVGVEWIKRAEESDALVLRVVEWGGEDVEAEVVTACPQVTARRANHLEDPGDPLPSTQGDFRIRLRAYEIATVLAECRE